MKCLTTAWRSEETITQKSLTKYILASEVLLVFTAEPQAQVMNMSILTTDAVVFNRPSCFMPKGKTISFVRTNGWVKNHQG